VAEDHHDRAGAGAMDQVKDAVNERPAPKRMQHLVVP
jgi:hypothetical protein